ncbi:hypothetical protein TWF694_000398 [Orbilia ellipsospora]|uniref:Glutamine synthetase n=1 Tax=Orbilia ellipsospora TaxID=2528407 RepID=A0AAV9XNT5_9PEZI
MEYRRSTAGSSHHRSLSLPRSLNLPKSSETTGYGSNTKPLFTVASSLSELEHIIDNCPIIDHHAHPILKKAGFRTFESVGLNLLQTLSEANSDSLKDVPNTLVFHRALRILQKNFSWRTPEGIHDWDGWKRFRDHVDELLFTNECFHGLQTILLDDGLRYESTLKTHDIRWHDQFLKSPPKRIMRLETVAEELMLPGMPFEAWSSKFFAEIKSAIYNRDIAGFKSVIGYRSGLEIAPLVLSYAAKNGYEKTQEKARTTPGGKFRIIDEALNTYIITSFATEMAKAIEFGGRGKPLQFHTGLGDSDLKLKNVNPVLLQKFIDAYPTVPIVILHAGYPYTREAGYLASVYQNVYLDFGLVFPMVSQEGQESVVRQVLELTPSSKAMWSTDGNNFAERYFLATHQMREVLKKVMGEIHTKESVYTKDLSSMVTDILFNTANKLYGLGLELRIPPPLLKQKEPVAPIVEEKIIAPSSAESLKWLEKFLANHKGIEYLRLNWLDYSGILRARVVKLRHAINQLEENEDGSILGVTKATLYLLANCYMSEGGTAVGEFRLVPDMSSIRLHPHKRDGETRGKHASVMCYIQDESHEPIGICPRGILRRSLKRASEVGLSDFKMGFEIEFCMFKQTELDEGNLVPISASHTWSTSRALQNKALVILEDIDKRLSEVGIEIEQFHSEAAKGQYEIILSPLPPMMAADSLIHAREVIQWVCAKYGYRASVIPKPFDGECGSAGHMHMSFKPVDKQWSFFAGVLDKIRAVNALTLGGEMSFERVIAGYWAGGLWGCWGRQNREAPLRLVEEKKAHWEVKCMDGMANIYLAMAGVITAGTKGVAWNRQIYGEATVDPSTLSEQERTKRGITTPMLKSMDEGIDALFKADGTTPTDFSETMGQGFAEHFAAVKTAERDGLYAQFNDPATGELDVLRRRVWAAQWY